MCRRPGQTLRNVNQSNVGTGIIHALDMQGDPVVFASVFGGSDEELLDTRPDVGRKFVGIRAGGQYTLNKNMRLLGNISYQYSRYDGDDPLFQERRRDHFIFTRLGLGYNLSTHCNVPAPRSLFVSPP